MNIKKLHNDAVIPTRGSENAAGFDLYTISPVEVPAGGMQMVRTGLAMAIPDGHFGAIYPRSGLASKYAIRLANCVGVIDSDYRGEIKLPLVNDGVAPVHIPKGTRVAQIIIQPYVAPTFEEVEFLDETERGEGGFGSTGTK